MARRFVSPQAVKSADRREPPLSTKPGTCADGGFTYQWDAESRLKSFNGSGATYTYDANGMRVCK